MLNVFSPAKINLFLQVLGKRTDGYHELSTLIQTVGFGDNLEIELASRDSLTCSDPLIPVDHSNLILKAAQLFRTKTGIKTGLKVHLHKRIPIQAGLGGGSSNAASTLWAFNQLVGQVATIEELQRWSAEIGSDIPFFFSLGTAHCTGRGEYVSNLTHLPPCPCWIIKPPIGLSTPDVYRAFQLNNSGQPSKRYLEEILIGQYRYFNDLEQPAFMLKPELHDLKQTLMQKGFDTVLMTGSGSAFFCLGKGQTFSDHHVKSYSTCFINRTPYGWYKN